MHRHEIVFLALAAIFGPGLAGEAAARSAPAASTLAIKLTRPGECRVVLTITNPRTGDEIGVVVELTELREQVVTAGISELSFSTGVPLREGFRIRARVNGDVVAQQVVPPAPAGSRPVDACTAPAPSTENSPFDASAYFGEVVDTFAPDSVGGYKNPSAGNAQKLRTIFGVDFDYRAIGKEDSRVQFWLNGETLHGVRTADIDCSAPNHDDRPPVCSSTSPFPDRAKYILEHATSLEAYVSPRLEFKTLQEGTLSPAKLYVTTRLGFIALEQSPRVFRTAHAALGLLADAGPFAGSYFEAGVGKNELFSGTNWRRLKIDGLLSFSLEKLVRVTDSSRFFIEMLIDNDLGGGADSVQTFFGVDVDLKTAFGQ
jgi:hypothetical protein